MDTEQSKYNGIRNNQNFISFVSFEPVSFMAIMPTRMPSAQ